LSWQREDRPASIDDWRARLGLGGAAPRLPPLQDLTAPAEPRRPVPRAALIGAILIVTAAALWALLSNIYPDAGRTLSGIIGSARDSAGIAAPAPAPAPAPNRVAPSPQVVTPPPPVRRAIVPAPALAPAPSAAVATTSAAPAAAISGTRVANRAVATAPEPARTEGSPEAASPHVAFAAQAYVVTPGNPAARIEIQRQPGVQGDLNFIWWTEGGSAEPEVDYASLGARTEHLANGQDKLIVYVPIISNPLRSRATQFQVALVDANTHRGEGGAPSARATVTIEGNR
jgi:hypothetical protein